MSDWTDLSPKGQELYERLLTFSHELVCHDLAQVIETETVLRHRILNVWKVLEEMNQQVIDSEGQYTAEIIAYYRDKIAAQLNEIKPAGATA